eukprot:237745_1
MTELSPIAIVVTKSDQDNATYFKGKTIKKSLNEDIYTLTAIVYAKNKKLPIRLLIISIFVCLLQFAGLLGLCYGYQTEHNTISALIYQIEYLKIHNTLLVENSVNSSSTNQSQIILKEITKIYGDDDNFNVFDKHSIHEKSSELDTVRIYLGFVSLFILLMYMLQSMSTATFFWYLPNYAIQSEYSSIEMLKYFVKTISVVNLLMIYVAWMIGVWTLFYFGDANEIIDVIMTPLGIVFVLEVDDWIVTPYLMIDISDDTEYGDIDDDYEDTDDLWIIETRREHIKKFKLCLYVEFVCMLLPPILYFIVIEIKRRKDGWNQDNVLFGDNMFSGGLAIFTYSVVGSVVIVAVGIRFICKYIVES